MVGFPAARKGDPVTHDMVVPSGVIGPPITGPCPPPMGPVMIEGLPAAHVTCTVVCSGATSAGPVHPPPVPPAPPPPIVKGSLTVFIHGMPAARWAPSGDVGACGVLLGDPKLAAARTVFIGDSASFSPGPVSLEEASTIFSIMSAQEYIAFQFPVDGCYARAHLMMQLMQRLGLSPGKVWTFASGPTDPLWVSTPNHPAGMVEWRYHVAPTIPVQGADGVVRDMVIDPSMFDRPVTIQEWKDAQHDTPTVVQTVPGESPLPSGEGSGYWPSPDPPQGPDAHAWETMEEYKPLEGTTGR